MGDVGVAWGAASTAISACLYLLDLGTTLSTLHSYYLYEYQCPHALLSSPILRDPICRAIRSGVIFISGIGFVFWVCIFSLALTHIIYAFIFCMSLDPLQHPLRLAYFMPLIHFYRLLRILRHSFSFKDLKRLQEDQAESNSLYNAIGAALETAPQFLIQFYIAIKLGGYVKGSADGNMQAQRIPTNLLLSLGASMLSACYSTAIAVTSITEKRIRLATRMCVGIVVGCQILVALLAKAICAAAFSQFSKSGFSISLFIYLISEVVISWIFIGLLLQGCEGVFQHKNRCLKLANSFGFALMTRFTSPTYVIVKFGKSPCWMIWGTLSQIFANLVGLALVLLRPFHTKQEVSLCHSFPLTSMGMAANKYMTCKVFLTTLFLSILVLIVTTMFLVWIEIKVGKTARVLPIASTPQTLCSKHNDAIFSHNRSILKECKGEILQQMRTSAFFRIFMFVFMNFLIQKLHRRFVLKGQASTNY